MRLPFIVAAATLITSFGAAATDLSPPQAAALAFAPTVDQPARAALHTHVVRSLKSAAGTIPYEATVDEYPTTADGKTTGLITTFGYTRTPASAKRPVVFLFNGGPGASSWSLHMEGFGPVRYDAASDTFADNPDSLLDIADLVFIDPLGTGSSAPFGDGSPQAAWSIEGDARSILSAVDAWLAGHGRQDARVFIVGESYGTSRATAMLHFASPDEAARIDGIALLSLALGGLPDPKLQAEGRAPSMAATAWFHHKGAAGAASGMDAFNQAVTAPVPPNLEDAATFRHHLLEGTGEFVGNLDTRLTAGKEIASLPVPYDDPGMTLGKRPSTLMARYMGTLGFRPPATYRMLNLTINRSWGYGGGPDEWPFAHYLADGLKANPGIRLFTAGGIYDLNTPAQEGVVTLRQVGVPAGRWTSRFYASGHTIGEDLGQRPVLAADLRRFITGK